MEFEVLSSAITSVLHVYKGEIVPEASFVSDFGADSIDLYQIYVQVEEQLHIKIDMQEIKKVKTVADALTIIENATRNGPEYAERT